MKNNYFAGGAVMIGDKSLPFVRKEIQGKFFLYAPADFSEDKNMVSQYTYLFSKDKSPLSIAIKYTPVKDPGAKRKMISNYFSGAPAECLEPAVSYRETVAKGKLLSIYSLRFSIEAEDGVMFGCFNADAAYMDDWREPVLEMLRSVEPMQ